MIGGDKPLRGQAEVEGRSVTPRTAGNAQAHGIGFVPEYRKARGLILDQSCAVNISLASLGEVSRGGRVSKQRLIKRAYEFRDTLDVRMTNAIDPAASLSGGSQQKVLIAKCLASGVRLICRVISRRPAVRSFCSRPMFAKSYPWPTEWPSLRHGQLEGVHSASDLDEPHLTALCAGMPSTSGLTTPAIHSMVSDH